MKAYEIELAKANGSLERLYKTVVSKKIRERYSIDEELAILRQKEEKPEEYDAYNSFAESCKLEARLEIYGNDI